jgi:hypothetical protein
MGDWQVSHFINKLWGSVIHRILFLEFHLFNGFDDLKTLFF